MFARGDLLLRDVEATVVALDQCELANVRRALTPVRRAAHHPLSFEG
jgi:hypothetical protein